MEVTKEGNAQFEEGRKLFYETYEKEMDDSAGMLHNQIAIYISQSRLPLPQVMLVLQMLIVELVDQAKAKYLGGN